MQNSINTYAKIEWHAGMPYSATFQDVYFSSDHGLLETEYVFLQGNDLSTRWQLLNTETFSIGETGFGTGLNFLCASQLWLETAPNNASLHFISVEKFPLTLQDITTALQLWPELSKLSTPLLTQYEALLNTGTISLYNNRVQLSLFMGDALQGLSGLPVKIDAWFLDGFAPAKNPDMWQVALFEAMAKHSRPNTSFATFTSAGIVRRGLLSAGFNVIKRTGFGKKREMLYGHFLKIKNDAK